MSASALTSVMPVAALPPLDPSILVRALPLSQPPVSQLPSSVSFSHLLSSGLEGINADLLQADKMVRAFALDDSIPVHQVTYALEQARLSLDLALQVRTRLIDGYQQLMNMQL